MIYKSKKEKDAAVLQFVGEEVMKGKSKMQAIAAAQEKFCIGSPATVYCCIRRCIKRRQLNEAQ